MKKLILLFIVIILTTVSCKDEVIEKPKNLIERNKMVDIIYDLVILEAAKSQVSGVQSYPKATKFIKEKYKIDSLTFAQSTQYYASDLKEYKKMYDEVKERLNAENKKLNGGKLVKENLEEGIVK
jgi:ABC-type phosphate transport system auxiliary subunit